MPSWFVSNCARLGLPALKNTRAETMPSRFSSVYNTPSNSARNRAKRARIGRLASKRLNSCSRSAYKTTTRCKGVDEDTDDACTPKLETSSVGSTAGTARGEFSVQNISIARCSSSTPYCNPNTIDWARAYSSCSGAESPARVLCSYED